MFTFGNIAETTDAMFPNVNIAMRLERIPHNKNVPPHPNKNVPPQTGRHAIFQFSQLAEVR